MVERNHRGPKVRSPPSKLHVTSFADGWCYFFVFCLVFWAPQLLEEHRPVDREPAEVIPCKRLVEDVFGPDPIVAQKALRAVGSGWRLELGSYCNPQGA